jgi:integrase
MPKLTVRTVEAARPSTSEFVLWDAELSTFGLRVKPTGIKSYVLQFRNRDGRSRRITIGRHGVLAPEEARRHARRLLAAVADGRDPAQERHDQLHAPSVAELAATYEAEHLPGKRPLSRRHDTAMIRADILPRLGAIKVASVCHDDVAALHRAVTARAPIRANRVLAVASKMFSLAMRKGWRADNPCRGVPRNPENERRRFLSQNEIARLFDALAAYPRQEAANAVRLLILTGARAGEVMTATWDHFDLDAGVWIKPSQHTKQKREHRVPLSPPALELLARIRAASKGPYVVPGRDPNTPISQLHSVWGWITKRAKIDGARLHDLRHTYASILVSSGGSLPLIGALLGHTQARTTMRYSHLMDEPLREATARVADYIAGATAGRLADVMPLRRGA